MSFAVAQAGKLQGGPADARALATETGGYVPTGGTATSQPTFGKPANRPTQPFEYVRIVYIASRVAVKLYFAGQVSPSWANDVLA